MCVCQSEHASISLRASGGVCATRAVNRCVPQGASSGCAQPAGVHTSRAVRTGGVRAPGAHRGPCTRTAHTRGALPVRAEPAAVSTDTRPQPAARSPHAVPSRAAPCRPVPRRAAPFGAAPGAAGGARRAGSARPGAEPPSPAPPRAAAAAAGARHLRTAPHRHRRAPLRRHRRVSARRTAPHRAASSTGTGTGAGPPRLHPPRGPGRNAVRVCARPRVRVSSPRAANAAVVLRCPRCCVSPPPRWGSAPQTPPGCDPTGGGLLCPQGVPHAWVLPCTPFWPATNPLPRRTIRE